jgi:tubulin-like protein CetZ
MKLSVIGLGQGGGNIADMFYAVNDYSESIFGRRLNILTDAFAINTDDADLGGFRHIPKDKGHRILVGSFATFGHGVGKINSNAADIIRASNLAVTDTILHSARFHESDAIMCIASGGGGTGSGMIGWTIKSIKERVEKPVYAMVVLPFAFEKKGETSFAVMNTATCINTCQKYADAVFMVDNERYRRAGDNLKATFDEVNKDIAASFYDLCCAGEERNEKFVGGKVMDAGDIKQSLEGFTNIGKGQVDLPTWRLNKDSFREGSRGEGAIFDALRLAEGKSSFAVELADARKILVLVSAPRDAISVNALEQITTFLQGRSPQGIIRIGDYPRRNKEIVVTLIASQLTRVPQLEGLFLQAEEQFRRKEEIRIETEARLNRLHAFSANIPTLD